MGLMAMATMPGAGGSAPFKFKITPGSIRFNRVRIGKRGHRNRQTMKQVGNYRVPA
jgi:hypothetical protein